MKKSLLVVTAVAAAAMFGAKANAQDVVVAEEDVTVTSIQNLDCGPKYYSSAKDNWFIQLGAGINAPLFERGKAEGAADPKTHFTATYNVGFGKWLNPYVGLRLGFNYGAMHWDNYGYSKARMANANFDLMWDMFNSFHGVNSRRVFSIVPFVGIGGTYAYHFDAPASNVISHDGKLRTNEWALPVSAGLQIRFRLCQYADLFFEGRAAFYGDNFNNDAVGRPIDIDITAIGGLSFNIGGADFKSYDPCSDLAYINSLNGQINNLRADLAATATALAVAESQLPCPEPTVVEVEKTVEVQTPANDPMMSTVRFTINSSKISNEEMVNVFNMAEYLKANPDVKIKVIGYADKDTGTAAYNMKLSLRRAQAVADALTQKYGIAADRLKVSAEGSSVQPYTTNDWNRIVFFQPQD